MNCEWVKANVALYVYDELADDARHELEAHVERCADCSGELLAVRGFKATMSALPQREPSPNMLASSRMRLQEALETAQQVRGWRRLVLDPMAWLRQQRFSPALAAVLVIMGFAGGVGTTYQIARSGVVNVVSSAPEASVTKPARTSEAAIASIAAIRDITQDASSNTVDIHYDTVVPQSVKGSLDDPRIRQLLLFAARNNQNTGVRMNSVGLLTQKLDDERIRQMLMYAAFHDSNSGVRLKALEALGPYAKGDLQIRNIVLEALMKDRDPAVRARAINMLHPVRADSSVRQVLEHLATQDRNESIRDQARTLLMSAPQID